jgi:hypothetical protein
VTDLKFRGGERSFYQCLKRLFESEKQCGTSGFDRNKRSFGVNSEAPSVARIWNRARVFFQYGTKYEVVYWTLAISWQRAAVL